MQKFALIYQVQLQVLPFFCGIFKNSVPLTQKKNLSSDGYHLSFFLVVEWVINKNNPSHDSLLTTMEGMQIRLHSFKTMSHRKGNGEQHYAWLSWIITSRITLSSPKYPNDEEAGWTSGPTNQPEGKQVAGTWDISHCESALPIQATTAAG